MNTQYKVICFYKDAPELCGEVYRNYWDQNSNLYSYQEANEMIQNLENDKIHNGQGFRLETA
jgi:hypothetical protein